MDTAGTPSKESTEKGPGYVRNLGRLPNKQNPYPSPHRNKVKAKVGRGEEETEGEEACGGNVDGPPSPLPPAVESRQVKSSQVLRVRARDELLSRQVKSSQVKSNKCSRPSHAAARRACIKKREEKRRKRTRAGRGGGARVQAPVQRFSRVKSRVKKNVQENLGGKTQSGREEGGRGKDKVKVEVSHGRPTNLSLPVPCHAVPCCRRSASETRGLNGDLKTWPYLV